MIRIEHPAPDLALVTLDRPAKRNALDRAGWRALGSAFAAMPGAVRVAVLTGAGGHFCAGDDIEGAAAAAADPVAAAGYAADIAACFAALHQAPFCVVAAIPGACVGGGLSLAMGCDFRVATTGAGFAIPAARLGLTYPVAQCGRLLALVGMGWARRILLGGQRLDAATALSIGLVEEVVAGDAVQAAFDLAAPMRDAAPLTVAATRRALDALATGMAAPQAAAIEAMMQAIAGSADAREGPRAFAEKRRPRFTGR
jgi:enoyl-CoA hydratase/carnithine racemase